MGKVTVYCIASGCTPEIVTNLRYLDSYGPIVTSALKRLADQHELRSQDDLCVIAPLHPSGELYEEVDGPEPPRTADLDPETDIRVLPHCVMGDSWDFGCVEGPPPNEEDQNYLISYGWALMVHTYALDIMALATHGRMTPLRLWRLAMQQGFMDAGHLDGLQDVEYGEIAAEWEQFPSPFPGFSAMLDAQLLELEEIGDVEVVKQQMVHEGYFWMWMAPDRFPVCQTEHDCRTWLLKEGHPSARRAAIECLPPELLILVVSFLPLMSVFNLTSASRSLHTKIFGNDYLACIWIYNNAPWWIPVPTQTPRKDDQPPTTAPRAHLASQWSTQVQLTANLPTNLDWAYARRCLRSGSMRNRKRIWNTVLNIEQVADLAGV